jgi:tRNA (cmo5U34)-methyltransferase
MSQFDWQPASYLALMREEIPDYEQVQGELVAATDRIAAEAILELGVGTGETSRRVLDAHPGARLHGLDASEEMLAAARAALAGRPVTLARARLEDPLPAGPFDLVVSALAVHHLDGPGKADLFVRVRAALRPGGRFVLADVVVPDDPRDAVIPLEPGYDLPSPVADQLAWLAAAGFEQRRVTWRRRDLAVLCADRSGAEQPPVP